MFDWNKMYKIIYLKIIVLFLFHDEITNFEIIYFLSNDP